MSLLQLWALARRSWKLLVSTVLLGVVAAAIISLLQPRLYSATSTGYVVAGNSASVGEAFAGSDLAAEKAATYLPLVQSRMVEEHIVAELGIDPQMTPWSLDASTEGVIFQITATAPTPELAAKFADAATRATSTEANALETLTLDGEQSGSTVIRIVPVELAQTPVTPTSPNLLRNYALGLALGLLTGFGLIVARRSLDRRVRQASDAEEATGVSALGIVPLSKELAEVTSSSGKHSAASEALRELRTNLRFVSVDDPARCIVVTSSNQGEGKSTISSHLASALAEAGQPTVLIDADLRRPVQAGKFGVEGGVGLTQVLAGSVQLDDALVRTSNPNLLLLPAGKIPPNPSELVGSSRMEALLHQLRDDCMVIVDAPPLLPVTDGALLTAASDGAILVVHQSKTRIEQLTIAARKLQQVEGVLLGTVLNMVPKHDLGDATFGYGYGSYSSDYYYSADEDKKESKTKPQGVKAQRAR